MTANSDTPKNETQDQVPEQVQDVSGLQSEPSQERLDSTIQLVNDRIRQLEEKLENANQRVENRDAEINRLRDVASEGVRKNFQLTRDLDTERRIRKTTEQDLLNVRTLYEQYQKTALLFTVILLVHDTTGMTHLNILFNSLAKYQNITLESLGTAPDQTMTKASAIASRSLFETGRVLEKNGKGNPSDILSKLAEALRSHSGQ